MAPDNTPEQLPFGIRRPAEPENGKLSRLEMLFVALALLALFYLGSLGARREDPWIKAAQAELQARTQLAQPPRRHLAVAEDD